MSVNSVAANPWWPSIAGGTGSSAPAGKSNTNQQFADMLQATTQPGQSSATNPSQASLATSQHHHGHHHTHGGAQTGAAHAVDTSA